MQATDRPALDPNEALARRGEDRRDPFDPLGDGREADPEGGELAGQEHVEPVAQQVDPLERIPGLGTQVHGVEAERGELAEHDVAVDRLIRGQRIDGERGEGLGPAIHESDEGPRARLGLVRPGTVVIVVAHPRGEDRAGPEEVGEEAVDELVEGGHGWLRAGSMKAVCGG